MINGRLYILDVKVCYPGEHFVQRTHDRNVAKYQAIADEYTAKGYKSPVIHTIIVPSAGCVPLSTHLALLDVGFSVKQSTNLLSRMSAVVCRQNELHLRRSLPKAQPPPRTSPTSPVEPVVPEPEPGDPAHGVELDPSDFESFPLILDDLREAFSGLLVSPRVPDPFTTSPTGPVISVLFLLCMWV
jgi:hypothetical protein